MLNPVTTMIKHFHCLCFVVLSPGKRVCWFCNAAQSGTQEVCEKRIWLHPHGGRWEMITLCAFLIWMFVHCCAHWTTVKRLSILLTTAPCTPRWHVYKPKAVHTKKHPCRMSVFGGSAAITPPHQLSFHKFYVKINFWLCWNPNADLEEDE